MTNEKEIQEDKEKNKKTFEKIRQDRRYNRSLRQKVKQRENLYNILQKVFDERDAAWESDSVTTSYRRDWEWNRLTEGGKKTPFGLYGVIKLLKESKDDKHLELGRDIAHKLGKDNLEFYFLRKLAYFGDRIHVGLHNHRYTPHFDRVLSFCEGREEFTDRLIEILADKSLPGNYGIWPPSYKRAVEVARKNGRLERSEEIIAREIEESLLDKKYDLAASICVEYRKGLELEDTLNKGIDHFLSEKRFVEAGNLERKYRDEKKAHYYYELGAKQCVQKAKELIKNLPTLSDQAFRTPEQRSPHPFAGPMQTTGRTQAYWDVYDAIGGYAKNLSIATKIYEETGNPLAKITKNLLSFVPFKRKFERFKFDQGYCFLTGKGRVFPYRQKFYCLNISDVPY